MVRRQSFWRVLTESCGWSFEEGGGHLVTRYTTNWPKWPGSAPAWKSLLHCQSLDQSSVLQDVLTEVLGDGANQFLAEAVQAEVLS